MTVTDAPTFRDLFRKPEPPPGEARVIPLAPHAAGTPYGLAALTAEAREVATAPEGSRNDRLNRAIFALSQLIAGGQLAPEYVHTTLTVAARAAGLPDAEIQATLASGYRAGTQAPRTPAPLPPIPEPRTLRERPAADTEDGESDREQDAPADAPQEPTEEERAAALEQWRAQQVTQEAERIRMRRAAERLVTAEEEAKTWREPPWRPTLTEELAIPDQPITYLIEDVFPSGGNVLLTAQYKTGKTTLVNAVARALADDEQFLDRFETHRDGGRVALWNYEVDENQYRRWLRDVGITNTNAVSVLNLRGYRMPVMVPRVEDWIVAWLVDREVTTWVVDPFARAFVGSGSSENDNTEVGAFLDTLDVIKERAGVRELILPTHTGRGEMERGEERARGATRLDDWADVRWLLTKDEQDVRYFRATGRDVDFPEERLNYDDTSRRLTLGGGDRAWEQKRRRCDAVVAVVHEHPGIGLAALRTALRAAGVKGRNEAIDAAISEAEYQQLILVEKAGNGALTRHFPARTSVLSEGARP